MSNNNNVQVKQQEVSEELKALIAERDRLKAMIAQAKKKADKVTYSVKETAKGPVGMLISGLGMPKFFYKQHLLAIVGDTPEAEAVRVEMRAWLQEHDAELTDKE